MKKIGIFLDEIHDQSIDDNQKFAKLGYNTGNMLFWHSLKTQLNLDVKSRWYIDHINQLDLSEYKAFVTTDLIWIKQNQDFSYLNKTLDAIGELPLVPISIGLQCDDYDYDFKLHPETVKVLNRISERCVMGVRGNYTAEILTKHGISNFQVIGCPSMYMPVDGFKTVSNDKKDIKKVSMNFETFYNKLDDKRIEFLEYGMENGFDFVEQAQAELEEKQIGNPETFQKVRKWIDSNGNIFFDLDEWRSYIREHDFSIGARFHGNVLALWEGVPALFVTCDSRTKELCEFFSLPMIDIADFDSAKKTKEYYERTDYTEFLSVYESKKRVWKEFLKLNDLVEKKKKVLYHAANAGCFVKCMIHRFVYHANDDAVFIGYSWLSKQFGIPSCYSTYMEYVPTLGPSGRYNDNTPQEALDRIILNFDKMFNENNIILKEFDDIYIGSYYGDFSFYVNHHNIIHSIFEEAAGDWGLLQWSNFSTFNELVKMFKMENYNNDNVKNRIGIFESWPKELRSDKDVNFVPYKDIHKLSSKNKEYISNFFKLPNNILFDREHYNVLLLTQWFTIEGKKWRDDGIVKLYKSFLDFYTPKSENVKIYIKPHPADPQKDNYEQILDSEVISSDCISEIMGLIENIHFDLSLTISSSSLKTVEDFSDALIQVGFNYIYLYPKINLYFVIISYLDNYINFKKIYRYGILDDINKVLCKSIFVKDEILWHTLENAGKSMIICDKLKWSDRIQVINTNQIDNDTICVFVDTKELSNNYNGNLIELLNDSLFFKVSTYDTITDAEEEQCFIVYCKNKKTVKKLEKFKMAKELKYQNLIINCSLMNVNESTVCKTSIIYHCIERM